MTPTLQTLSVCLRKSCDVKILKETEGRITGVVEDDTEKYQRVCWLARRHEVA
jgi:hypothetical protein